jgi:hypothetical protein
MFTFFAILLEQSEKRLSIGDIQWLQSVSIAVQQVMVRAAPTAPIKSMNILMMKNIVFFVLLPPMAQDALIAQLKNMFMGMAEINASIVAHHQAGADAPIAQLKYMKSNANPQNIQCPKAAVKLALHQ